MIKTTILNSLVFDMLCQASDTTLIKVSFIHKTPSGWRVFSHKGKLLGTYKTKAEAVKRLKQIEWFKKHKKKASLNEEITYSGMMRELSRNYPEYVLKKFRQIYKSEFDNAILQEKDNPEELALNSALQYVDTLDEDLNKIARATDDLMFKVAAGNELGNPQEVGIYLSNLIKFILRKISVENRGKSILNVKRKILGLNELELAGKKMPASASIGQSLVIIKHLMFGKDPSYIRQVLNSVAANL